jgi:hypothetical protein
MIFIALFLMVVIKSEQILFGIRVARFFLLQYTKTEKNIPMTIKYIKLP